jgi:hypothetical protein
MKLKSAFIRAARTVGMTFVALIGPAQAVNSLTDVKVVGGLYLWAAVSALNVGVVALVVNLLEDNTPLSLGPKG